MDGNTVDSENIGKPARTLGDRSGGTRPTLELSRLSGTSGHPRAE